jgi:murein DD-endopeptidase MepM/ murein hydrolase activator NlpD
MTRLPAITFCAALLLWAGTASNVPRICELDIGETCTVSIAGGKQKTVKLAGYREQTEPYFETATGAFVNAVVSAHVDLEIDGERSAFEGGPFRMPVAMNGLSVLLNCTKNWTTGVVTDPLEKDVRLELKDASAPFYEPDRFVYPVRNYRWRVNNYQHSWLALAVNQARHYYHRGEDLGMIPDLEEVLSMTDGVVRNVPGPNGDGASNAFVVEDPGGLTLLYAHMNAPHIRQDLQPGVKVRRGETLGLTGNTWRGSPVSDPHLHVEAPEGLGSGAESWRNTFPVFVNAYLATFPGSVLPIAGGWRHTWAGSSIELDASLSVSSPGRKIRSYEWTFTDGSTAKGATVKRHYSKIGAYSEQVRVTDDSGASDLDFVEVFVLDEENKKAPPYIWMNYYPIRGIKPGTEVRFLTRFSNVKNVKIDFGDGTTVAHALNLQHKYGKPGTYIVTAKGRDSGSGPGIFKVRVVIEP